MPDDLLEFVSGPPGYSPIWLWFGIALLILVGQWIGLWPTLGLLVLSAFVGMAVIRRQGLSMFSRMFDTMGRGGLF